MRLHPRSLYTRLMIALLVVLALAGSGLIVAAWFYSGVAADSAYDQVLISGALQIAENCWMHDGVLNVDVPLAPFSVLSTQDRVFYKVTDPSQRVVAGDPSLRVDVPLAEIRRGPVVRSARFHGQAVRVAVVGRHVVESDPNGWAVVVLAETLVARHALAANLTRKALWIVSFMGLITIVAVMLAAQRALKPLRDVARAIGARDADSREALHVDAPAEAEVLVQTINDFIDRLNARIALMRRVIGDVSHQIRTPLTAISSQLEMWEHADGEAARRLLANRIKQRLREVGQLSSQLLSHAMVLHRAEEQSLQPVDVTSLVRLELMRLLEQRASARWNVSFDAPDAPVVVPCDPVTLKEALRNVFVNALDYGVRQQLAVSIVASGSVADIRVDDDGPGISETRQRALRTPFTPRDGGRDGASLGLAIVEEVLRAHHGELRFERTGHGHFRVVLSLPLHGAAAAPLRAEKGPAQKSPKAVEGHDADSIEH